MINAVTPFRLSVVQGNETWLVDCKVDVRISRCKKYKMKSFDISKIMKKAFVFVFINLLYTL